jgi:glucose dehydrogenase
LYESTGTNPKQNGNEDDMDDVDMYAQHDPSMSQATERTGAESPALFNFPLSQAKKAQLYAASSVLDRSLTAVHVPNVFDRVPTAAQAVTETTAAVPPFPLLSGDPLTHADMMGSQ